MTKRNPHHFRITTVYKIYWSCARTANFIINYVGFGICKTKIRFFDCTRMSLMIYFLQSLLPKLRMVMYIIQWNLNIVNTRDKLKRIFLLKVSTISCSVIFPLFIYASEFSVSAILKDVRDLQRFHYVCSIVIYYVIMSSKTSIVEYFFLHNMTKKYIKYYNIILYYFSLNSKFL